MSPTLMTNLAPEEPISDWIAAWFVLTEVGLLAFGSLAWPRFDV